MREFTWGNDSFRVWATEDWFDVYWDKGTDGGLREVALVLRDEELVVLAENVLEAVEPFTGARGGKGGGESTKKYQGINSRKMLKK